MTDNWIKLSPNELRVLTLAATGDAAWARPNMLIVPGGDMLRMGSYGLTRSIVSLRDRGLLSLLDGHRRHLTYTITEAGRAALEAAR